MSATNKTITLEVSEECYSRVRDLASAMAGTTEETVMFSLEQVLNAPEPAIKWLTQASLAQVKGYEGHRPPSSKDAFAACVDAERVSEQQKNKPALDLAAAVKACCR